MSDTPELTVTYQNSDPKEVEYYHITLGLMKFCVVGSTAVVNPEWDELEYNNLKDEYKPWVTTQNVVEAVEELPFVQAVDMGDEDE